MGYNWIQIGPSDWVDKDFIVQITYHSNLETHNRLFLRLLGRTDPVIVFRDYEQKVLQTLGHPAADPVPF